MPSAWSPNALKWQRILFLLLLSFLKLKLLKHNHRQASLELNFPEQNLQNINFSFFFKFTVSAEDFKVITKLFLFLLSIHFIFMIKMLNGLWFNDHHRQYDITQNKHCENLCSNGSQTDDLNYFLQTFCHIFAFYETNTKQHWLTSWITMYVCVHSCMFVDELAFTKDILLDDKNNATIKNYIIQ